MSEQLRDSFEGPPETSEVVAPGSIYESYIPVSNGIPTIEEAGRIGEAHEFLADPDAYPGQGYNAPDEQV